MNTYLFLMVFCLILIGSFFFNYLQKKLHISAVILLLLSGIALQLALPTLGMPDAYLKIFGTLGLLIIVLEAVVDLEVHGHNYKMLIHKDMKKLEYIRLWRFVKKGKSYVGEINGIKKDGESFLIDLFVEPYFSDTNKIIGYTIIAYDTTNKKKIEETMEIELF